MIWNDQNLVALAALLISSDAANRVIVVSDNDTRIFGAKPELLIIDDVYIQKPEPWQGWYDYPTVYHNPAPRKILPNKQAQVRQSIRQSMRSVNRNR